MKDILNRFGDRFFTRAFWLHFCCWVLFIVYELGMVRLSVGKLEEPYIYIYYYALNITFFYGYLEILNFTFRGRRNKVVAGLCFFALLIIIYMGLKLVVDTYLIVNQPSITNPFIYIQKFIPRNLIRGFYFVVLATFYWSAGHISTFRRQAVDALKKQISAQKEKMELEGMLNRSKNAYLQHQINPHMIFNALNFVYSTTQRYSDEAADCIWLLSEIMRFSLEDTGTDGKVGLEKEIQQIENIIAINRYRYNNPIYVELKAVGDFSHLRIIPLILLTLTENVFKHGNLLDSNHPGIISLETTASGQFKFFTLNARKTASIHQRTKRLGLENVRVRLDAACAGDYKLDIKQTDNFFELSLTLNL